MLRSLSAGIFGVCIWGAVGCTGPVVQSRIQNLQIDPHSYVVQAGDTLESIAFRYRLSAAQLASMNPGSSGGVMRGQHLQVRPAQGQVISPAASVRVPVQYVNTGPANPPVVVTAVTQGSGVLREEIIADDDLPLTPAVAASAPLSSGGWRWPSAGEVVRDYAPGEVNGQGIDIAGVPGQEIYAVGNGTVIYAGRDLSNSGNLVIIRHPEDVLSTYSYTKDLFVAEDDIVRGGDPIASLGWNSNRESVLHFGIRKNGKPVNPAQYLPRR